MSGGRGRGLSGALVSVVSLTTVVTMTDHKAQHIYVPSTHPATRAAQARRAGRGAALLSSSLSPCPICGDI